MKKLIKTLTIILMLGLSACQFSNNFDNKEIQSISYEVFNGLGAYESEKFYDLEDLTYYETEKQAGRFVKENVYLDLDPAKVTKFSSNIVDHGIFDLKKKYSSYVTDANYWYLTITFTDGTTFKSQGYHVYPDEKDVLDNDFYELSEYYLFKGNLQVFDPLNVYKLETATFAVEGESYGVSNLQYQFGSDDSLFTLFGINSQTDYKLITKYYDYIRLWSTLSGESIEEMDPEVVNPMYSGYYWIYIKRTANTDNECLVDYNLFDVRNDEVTINLNYLDKVEEGNDAIILCYDLIKLPSRELKDIDGNFTLKIEHMDQFIS